MKKRIHIGLAILVILSASLACSQFTSGFSQLIYTGKIVYQSDLGGNWSLYSMDVHGGIPARLTNNSSNNVSPTFISATNQIGFVSDIKNGWNLYTIDIFGGNLQTITNNKDTPVDYPNWSPDGKLIAASLAENCTPSVTTCNYDIYVMNTDDTNRKKITNTTASECVPVWTPDGQRIAFASDRDGDGEIYVMNKDGSNVLQLTNNKGYDGSPRWSPD